MSSIGSALLAWKSTKHVHLPQEVLLDNGTGDGEVFLEVPSPIHMLAEANKHARTLYGRDALSLSEIKKWFERNPFVEAVLRSGNGNYLGYFDVLPLTAEGVKAMESGEVGEGEIHVDHILTPGEMGRAEKLYLGGIAVKEAGAEIGRIRAAKLFYGLVSYIEHYYGKTNRKMLALAATADGEHLLKGIGAKVVIELKPKVSAGFRNEFPVLSETAENKTRVLRNEIRIRALKDEIIELLSDCNRICTSKRKERIFRVTDTMLGKLAKMGKPAKNEAEFGNVVDALFEITYEGSGNLERIPEQFKQEGFIGFTIKHIRNDLRHDLEHGKEKEVAEKKARLAKIYRRYCGKTTLSSFEPEDFPKIELGIYSGLVTFLKDLKRYCINN